MDIKYICKSIFRNSWKIFGGFGVVIGTVLAIHSVYLMLLPEVMPIYKGSVSSYIKNDGTIDNPFASFIMDNLNKSVYLELYLSDQNLLCDESLKYAACVYLSEVAGSETASFELRRDGENSVSYSIRVNMEGINKAHGGKLAGYWAHADGGCGSGAIRAEIAGFFRFRINRVAAHQYVSGWITSSDTILEKETIEKAISLKANHIEYDENCTPLKIIRA